MDKELIAVAVNQVVLPELLGIIRRRFAAGEPITEEAVRAELAFDADRVITQGEAWLAANPKE